jgi:glucose-6-phosphate isomerase
MKKIIFSYEKTGTFSSSAFESIFELTIPALKRMQETVLAGGYETDYASINLPFDMSMFEKVQLVVDAKRALRPTVLVVIGIGGSHLGTLAVQQALLGTHYNAQQPDIKIYYVDSVDADYTYDVYLLVEQALQEGHTVLLNVISKSGSTIETVANFHLFTHLIKQYQPDTYRDAIVITTDHGSALWEWAQQESCDCLEIPTLVGGRYSVFSPVGLFPLGMLGVDITLVLAGAADGVRMSINTEVYENPAALSAILLSHYYRASYMVHDTFLWSVDLGGFGLWYRQLMAESIGKLYDRGAYLVRTGMLPTVSLATADLHSMAQLYFAGPQNRVTTFVTVEKNKAQLVIPRDSAMKRIGVSVQGKTYSRVMDAILHGVQQVYQNQELPFMTISLPEKTAYYLGQLLQIKMCEIMYLGFLFDINPFDQPQVELYKQETRKILSHE